MLKIPAPSQLSMNIAVETNKDGYEATIFVDKEALLVFAACCHSCRSQFKHALYHPPIKGPRLQRVPTLRDRQCRQLRLLEDCAMLHRQ